MSNDRSMFSARIPDSLIRDVNMDPRNNQEILEVALRREVGSHDAKMLEIRADKVESTAEAYSDEATTISEQADEKRKEAERLREQAAQVRKDADDRLDVYDSILDGLADADPESRTPQNLSAYMSDIQTIEDGSELSRDEIVQQLRERYDERDEIELVDADAQLSFGGVGGRR